MSTIANLARLRRLSRTERALLLRALAILPMAALGLQLAGLKRIQSALLLLSPARPGANTGDAAAYAKQVARWVSVAARHGPYRAKCLPSALALQSILRRHGIESDLRLGVRRESDRIEAHAWIEHRGVPLIDSADVADRYAAFAEPIRPRKVR